MEPGYPKTKYHVRGGGSIQVTTAAQEKALGEEWVDIRPPAPSPAKPTELEIAKPSLEFDPIQEPTASVVKRGRKAKAG